MTEAERIEKNAREFTKGWGENCDLKSYIAGAKAENQRLQQELRDAVIGQEQLALDLVRTLDLNKSLEDQIEYQNKLAKENHDKICKLEFELKSAQQQSYDQCEIISHLEQQLKEKDEWIRKTSEAIDNAWGAYNMSEDKLKSAQELNRDLVQKLVAVIEEYCTMDIVKIKHDYPYYEDEYKYIRDLINKAK